MDSKPYSTLARLMPEGVGSPSYELDPVLRLIAASSPYTARCSWAAAFISSPTLSRDWHVDWYDSLLVPVRGKKTIYFMDAPTKVASLIYSYSDDHGFKPTIEGVKGSSTVDVYPGEALSIPAFYPHKVVNDSQQECVAISLAFDNSYPLAYLIPDLYAKISKGRWGSNPKHLINLCNYRVHMDSDFSWDEATLLEETGEPKLEIYEKIRADLHRNQITDKERGTKI